jgi:excisionase family DNA binding protein
VEEKLMTLKEVAEYLKFSKSTIYRFVQQNKMPAAKIGNQWRFCKEAIDEWVSIKTNWKSKDSL